MTDRRRREVDYDSTAYEPGNGALGFHVMMSLGRRPVHMNGPGSVSVPHFYAGTVPRKVVDGRRRKAKAARRADRFRRSQR